MRTIAIKRQRPAENPIETITLEFTAEEARTLAMLSYCGEACSSPRRVLGHVVQNGSGLYGSSLPSTLWDQLPAEIRSAARREFHK